MGNKWTVPLDLLMQSGETVSVFVDGESWDRPVDLSEEVNDGPDIVEDRAQ
jgi:hypothetical protein